MSREAYVSVGGGRFREADRLRVRTIGVRLRALSEVQRPTSMSETSDGRLLMTWSDGTSEDDVRAAVSVAESVVSGWLADDELVDGLRYFLEQGMESFSGLEDVHTDWSLPCCQSCGVGELRTLFDEGETQGPHYAFCHEQDVVGLGNCGGIGSSGYCCLCFGSFDAEVEQVTVGDRVAAALRRAGFVVEWNGDVSRRIRVRLDVRTDAKTVGVA